MHRVDWGMGQRAGAPLCFLSALLASPVQPIKQASHNSNFSADLRIYRTVFWLSGAYLQDFRRDPSRCQSAFLLSCLHLLAFPSEPFCFDPIVHRQFLLSASLNSFHVCPYYTVSAPGKQNISAIISLPTLSASFPKTILSSVFFRSSPYNKPAASKAPEWWRPSCRQYPRWPDPESYFPHLPGPWQRVSWQ